LLSFEESQLAFFIDMSKFILAKKVNMTQIFGEDGRVSAVTVLSVAPVKVSQVKTLEKDGYTAVQVLSPLGKKIGTKREFRIDEKLIENFKKDDEIKLDTFAVGDKVEVSSISKGKGFQGVVKRHGFHGGPRSHGQKHSEREPGSIGGSGGRAGGRVAKGMRMAGRMGSDRTTVKNLKVLGIDAENNVMLISGALPGRRGTLVEIISNSK
jgi:large subunit ribosomal protein L3